VPYTWGMNSLDANIVTLALAHASAKNVSLWRVGHLAAGRGSFFVDLASGKRTCTTDMHIRVTQWFSDHWPADTPWPADIPRPAPTPGSPASEEVA